jgi:hypothetical protein
LEAVAALVVEAIVVVVEPVPAFALTPTVAAVEGAAALPNKMER